MGALPSQKYDMVLLAFARWYNQQCAESITEDMIDDFLRKCDRLEIEI